MLCFNLLICKGIKAKLVIGVLGFCGGENLRELGKQQVGQDIISPLNKKYNIKQMSDENKEKYQFGGSVVWKTARRISNEILVVKGFTQCDIRSGINPGP